MTPTRISAAAAAAVAVAIATLQPATARADEFRPAVVFAIGSKFDGSFNEGVWNGVSRFMEETGVEVMEAVPTDPAQREDAMRRVLRRGATVVLGVGFDQADVVDAAANEHPDRNFAIIDVDWLEDRPNLRQYRFAEHEGAYLAGVASALATRSGTVGFVGGMDIPLIRRVACGYAQGAKETRADVRVIRNMTGTTPAAWNDPTRGAEIARSQMDRGADVIFHGAGTTGLGVIRAVADEGRLAIGVDSDQHQAAPGHVLTSMLKRADIAARDVFMAAMDGEFTGGVVNLGVAEGGVDLVMDDNNADLMTADMRAAVERAKEGIVSGGIAVHDYEEDGSCPY